MPKNKAVRCTWTAADLGEFRSLANKKIGAAEIANALKRTTRAVENKSYLLGGLWILGADQVRKPATSA